MIAGSVPARSRSSHGDEVTVQRDSRTSICQTFACRTSSILGTLVSAAKAYNVYHSYDANNSGRSMLRISELVWDADGWPVSGGP